MTHPASLVEPACSGDARLAELIDQLTARLQAGAPIDMEACLREHPEHAQRLEKLLPALRMLADASASRSGGAITDPAGEAPTRHRLSPRIKWIAAAAAAVIVAEAGQRGP